VNGDSRRAVVAFALLGTAGMLEGCGGGGSTPAGNAPSPSVTSRQTTLVNAARGTLTVVLTALETASYYGNYLRPGVGLALGAQPAATNPTCDATTHTASTAFPNQTGTTTLVTTAFYPANDDTCSQSPFRILVMQYTLGSPQAGFGYQLTYPSPNDPYPFASQGFALTSDAISTTIYKTQNGSANIVASIAPGGAETASGALPPQPLPGTFPATFPTGLPHPPPAAPFGFFFATVESGASSTTSAASLQGQFPTPASFIAGDYTGHVASSDDYAVTSTETSGNVSLSLVDRQPRFITDIAQGIVPTVTPSYPFSSGATSLELGPISALGYRSSLANLPKPIAGSATIDASGKLIACSESATDPLDGVLVQATCADGGASIALTVTDVFAKTSAIEPATITLDGTGFGTTNFTFVIDGSVNAINEFVLNTGFSGSSSSSKTGKAINGRSRLQ